MLIKYTIYRISCLMNQKVYIGQTCKRLSYRYGYKFNSVTNERLKEDINKYGVDNFIIEEIDSTNDRYEAEKLEKWYIKFYKATNINYGYNISGGKGIQSEETRKKMSISHLGHKQSEESKQKISKAGKGKKHSKESIEKMRLSKMGHVVTEEARKKIGLRSKGNKNSLGKKASEETRKKLSNSHKGKRLTEEQKKKISDAGLERWKLRKLKLKEMYYKQEKDWSCSASAVRNAFVDFGIELSEGHLRRLMKIDKDGGDDVDIIKIVTEYGFDVDEIETKSGDVFKNKLIKNLKEGNKIIVLVDNTIHWVLVAKYNKRRVKVVDSRFVEDLDKDLTQWVTTTELAKRANNFDIETNKFFYYAIVLKQ